MERERHDAARLRDEHAAEEQRARVHVPVEREGQLLERALAVERAHRRVVRHLLAHHAHAQRRAAHTWAAGEHVALPVQLVVGRARDRGSGRGRWWATAVEPLDKC